MLTNISLENFNISELLLKFKSEVLYDNSDEIVKLYNFYMRYIECRASSGSALRAIEQQVKLKDQSEQIRKVWVFYMNSYYNSEETKAKRKYYDEYAGMGWSEEDKKKFQKGCEIYKNTFLPNNKIAKYMGKHIYSSHVKAMRNKIIKENRCQRKILKKIKMTNMKRKRGKVWKKEKLSFDYQ